MKLNLLSRLTSFGTGQIQKPLYVGTIIMLILTLTINSVLIAGCTSSSPGIRKFYLISLKYNPDSSKSTLVTDLDKLLSNDKGEKGVFNDIRIGYSGICIETKKDKEDGGWHCAKHAHLIAKDLAGDPAHLVKVADLYKDKISFVTPLYLATCILAVSFLMVLINCIPAIPVRAVTRKIAAGTAGLGSLLLLGCMCLQHVTSSAISTLVGQLGMNAVLLKVGSANAAFGWASYGTSAVAAIATIAVVTTEYFVEKAQSAPMEYLEKAQSAPMEYLERGVSALRRGGSSTPPYPPSAVSSLKRQPSEESEGRKNGKYGRGGISVMGAVLGATKKANMPKF